ncbi:MAG: hypothetical protein WDN30_02980 [Pararobbsia sp.]
MRSSIMLVPPLLARFGVARLENDVKGCTLGVREIDPHVEVFERFGARVERTADSLVVRAHARMTPNQHWLDYASVTTTENFVLCAARSRGHLDARERGIGTACPGVLPLPRDARVEIDGIGTSRLCVAGGRKLGGGTFRFSEDFHEITTFLALGAITGGDIAVRNTAPEQFPLIDRTFAKFGVQVEHRDGWSRAVQDGPLRGAPAVHAEHPHEGRSGTLALPPGRPAADLHCARRACRRQRDVLEQGLRRRDGLVGRTLQVRRARIPLRPAPPDHLRRPRAQSRAGSRALTSSAWRSRC